MSRIHEALKKAEQERNSAQPVELSTSDLSIPVIPDELPVASLPAMPVTTMSTTAMPAAAAPQPARSMPGKVESGIAGCLRTEWKPDSNSMLFFDSSRHYEVGMEEFRTLRSRLSQIREKKAIKIVLVGSALPGEGKSFVAANLAQALARQHGRRVLLIDADLRRPSLHERLGTRATPGMTDYLSGTADAFAVIQRGPMEGLFFIPKGSEVTNPAELIANGRCKALLAQLAPHFDWIVIDTPPAIPVTDASVLAEHCDGVVLVIRAGSTPFEQAQRASREFRDKSILGVVLNQATTASGYKNYYHKGYGGQSAPVR